MKNLFKTRYEDNYLIIDIQAYSISYCIVYYSKHSSEIILKGSYNQWATKNGSIYDFQELSKVLKKIRDKIADESGITVEKSIFFLNLNYFQLLARQHNINTGKSLANDKTKWTKQDIMEEIRESLKPDFDIENYELVHNCDHLFLLNENILLDSITNVKFHGLQVYTSFFVLPKFIYDNIKYQCEQSGFKENYIFCPHYLLATVLSERIHNDVIILDLGYDSSFLISNHDKFCYNYLYFPKGLIDFFSVKTPDGGKNNTLIKYSLDNQTVERFLQEIFTYINKNPKATIIIAGNYAKKINLVKIMQSRSNRRFFYLDSLLESESNCIFYNLVFYYREHIFHQFVEDEEESQVEKTVNDLSDILM